MFKQISVLFEGKRFFREEKKVAETFICSKETIIFLLIRFVMEIWSDLLRVWDVSIIFKVAQVRAETVEVLIKFPFLVHVCGGW